MSGFILTASLVGQVTGVAGFTGIYLSHAPGHPGSGLAVTAGALAACALLAAGCARAAVVRATRPSRPVTPRRRKGPTRP
jgi:hypothetical protein